MSPLRTNVLRRAVALLERQKGTVVLAAVIALTSSGVTAAAVSYVVLGGVSQTGATTTLRSNVIGAVLQVTNFDTTGGTGARGININVPAGRSPITVNSTGKATNLNADMVDGLNANAFLGVNQTAANAGLLDGKDSTAFMTGPGNVVWDAWDFQPGQVGTVAAFVGHFWSIIYFCPPTVSGNGVYRLTNTSAVSVDVFIDNGGENPEYLQMAAGAEVDRATAATGEWIDIQMFAPLRGMAEISLFTVHRPATPDCHAQLQAVVSAP